jgi:hypothetical protein
MSSKEDVLVVLPRGVFISTASPKPLAHLAYFVSLFSHIAPLRRTAKKNMELLVAGLQGIDHHGCIDTVF